jgi:hypothetical protein
LPQGWTKTWREDHRCYAGAKYVGNEANEGIVEIWKRPDYQEPLVQEREKKQACESFKEL